MLNDGILKLVFAKDSIPDLTMEAYLSSRPGIIGAIGFQRIAESHAEVTKKAKNAETELKSFVEDAARIMHGIEPGGAVTAQQEKALKDAIKADAAKAVKDRPGKIGDPPPAEEEKPAIEAGDAPDLAAGGHGDGG